jgi:WG containing repeat
MVWRQSEKIRNSDSLIKTGKVVIQPQFDWTYSFSEGLAAVRKDGKWGFIDKTGKFVISPQYDEVWSFDNGLCGVGVGEWKTDKSEDLHSFSMPYLDGKWGYIDKTGKYIWKPTK